MFVLRPLPKNKRKIKIKVTYLPSVKLMGISDTGHYELLLGLIGHFISCILVLSVVIYFQTGYVTLILGFMLWAVVPGTTRIRVRVWPSPI